MSIPVEVYILFNDYLVTVKTNFIRFDGNYIYVESTPMLHKFGVEGQKVFLKFKSFILHTKIAGRNEDSTVLEFPQISPEKPLGDRKSVRVPPLKSEDFKVSIGDLVRKLYDISEEGFGIYSSPEDVDYFRKKLSLPFSFELPRIKEVIQGKANLVNIREYGDKIICGFEMSDVSDADSIKIRFYIYERIKEMLEGKE